MLTGVAVRVALVLALALHGRYFDLHRVLLGGVDASSGVVVPQPKLTNLRLYLRVRDCVCSLAREVLSSSPPWSPRFPPCSSASTCHMRHCLPVSGTDHCWTAPP